LARAAEAELGRTITVNNITGGGGAVGFAAGLLAPADGHTITTVTFELVSLPVQGLVPFNYQDFDLLMRLNMDPSALAIRADLPVNTLEEFIAWANTQETVRIGNSGPGSVWHLAGEKLVEAVPMPARFVPFGGAAPAVTALVGGHIDAVTVGPGEVRTQVLAGQAKILAVMSDERVGFFPDIPTFRERGIDLVFGTWRGLALPKGTPEAARARLVESFMSAAKSPELAEFAASAGLNLAVANTEEFRAMVAEQDRAVSALMQKLGMAR
jgi:tripartite-type tricarboxylate transporter receptor subunit TctC